MASAHTMKWYVALVTVGTLPIAQWQVNVMTLRVGVMELRLARTRRFVWDPVTPFVPAVEALPDLPV